MNRNTNRNLAVTITEIVTKIDRRTGEITETVQNFIDEVIDLATEQNAVVTVGAERGYNLGNYESLRVKVEIAYPCEPDDVGAVFKELGEKLPKRIDRVFKHICEVTGVEVKD